MDEIATYSDGPVSGAPVPTGRSLLERTKAAIEANEPPPAQIAPASITREDIGLESRRNETEAAERRAKNEATVKAVENATEVAEAEPEAKATAPREEMVASVGAANNAVSANEGDAETATAAEPADDADKAEAPKRSRKK